MKLGKKVKVSKLDLLLQKSEGIKNVFTNTMHELDTVNQEIDEEVTSKVRRIEQLQHECSTLNETRSANAKMRQKMATFLGLEDDSDAESKAVEA